MIESRLGGQDPAGPGRGLTMKEFWGLLKMFYPDCSGGYTATYICQNLLNHTLKIGDCYCI